MQGEEKHMSMFPFQHMSLACSHWLITQELDPVLRQPQKNHCVSSMAKLSVKTEYHSNHTRKKKECLLVKKTLVINREQNNGVAREQIPSGVEKMLAWMMLERK